jgi:glycosyltransferase involved in cell wall biosynthesis
MSSVRPATAIRRPSPGRAIVLSQATEHQHEIADLERSFGELSFEARIGPTARRIWFRTETKTLPAAEAALAACLMPAMRLGGSLGLAEPISPRVLRSQPEFQAIQRTWSPDWSFDDRPLREIEVTAPARPVESAAHSGRVAAFFSGGVDSWATVLSEPDLTDLIFVEGFDLRPGEPHHAKLSGEVEARLRATATELGLPLHVVRTNLRELSDPLVRWEAYYGCALVAVAFLFEPIFDRVLIAGEFDYEVQERLGASWMVDQLWSAEALEIVDAGSRLSRVERTRLVAEHRAAQRSLRVCWENPDGAYNCGRCGKCLRTMVTLEALGLRGEVETFPSTLDLDAIADIDFSQPPQQTFWEDVLDAARAAGRIDLERAVEGPVQRAKRTQGLPPSFRRRRSPGPAPSVRIAVVVPAWKHAQYLAGAVGSALAQEAPFGVGVTIVDDGCPDPETERIGGALRDANPDRVDFLRQANAGVAASRNAGVRQAIRRWPGVEAFFFLDADNLLSPQTIAKLWQLLEESPELSWTSPALEKFGVTQEEWNVFGPHLTYHQLFANQSDTGALVRRTVFEAGLEFDETMRKGFEDWEFFLRAGLAGFAGAGAGRCGFRYRALPDSMLVGAQRREEEVKADIRHRNADAYRAGSLCRREHAEAPRFALVRCDRADALLLAAVDLEPRQVPLTALCEEEQAAAVIVLTTAGNVEALREQRLLAGLLMRLQLELHSNQSVALEAGGERIATAVTPAALGWLRLPDGALWIERHLDLEVAAATESLPVRGEPLAEVLDSLCAVPERPIQIYGAAPQGRFFQEMHLDRLETTVPWAGPDGGRTLLALAPVSGGEGWDGMVERIADARAHEPDLAAHLVLTEAPAAGDPPRAGFDTQACLGGADPESAALLVERLRAGADLIEDLIGAGRRESIVAEAPA